jgi:MerR family mercuric resistance operon transcriptional regulator/MerR family gold-responsive transcriptional activator of gol and ges genes
MIETHKVRGMTFTIGHIADAASVNIQTIRYYERRGLLLPSGRTRSGYREYDRDAIRRLRFIKHAQALGFSLKEIQDLLALRVGSASACPAVERRTRAKIEVIDGKLRELERLKGTLIDLAAACRARKPTAECPVLESLEDDNAGSGE